ncbi:hypothetical protein KIPB_014606, partial [Kipferlia bialata]
DIKAIDAELDGYEGLLCMLEMAPGTDEGLLSDNNVRYVGEDEYSFND